MSTKTLKPCDKCKGCGKLDSKERKPWTEVTRPLPNPDVRSGAISPVECPECKGSGMVGEDPSKLVPVADGQGTNTNAGLTNVAAPSTPAK